MSKKILGLIVIIVLIFTIGFMIFWLTQKPSSRLPGETVVINQPSDGEDNSFNQTLVKKDFSIKVPAGWQEIPPSPGMAVLVVDMGNNNNQNGWRNFYSVIRESFKGQSLEEYIKQYKSLASELTPGVKFISEKDSVVDSLPAKFLEAEVNKAGTIYKTLLVLVSGGEGEVWTLAFNTTAKEWQEKEKLFTQMAESFTLK